MSSSQRGAALLLAIFVTATITVIAVAMIRLSSREVAGARSARQDAALVACAEAGRQMILSQFRSVGVSGPTGLQPLGLTLDNATSGSTRVVGGHVDDANVQVHQVTVLPGSTYGVQRNSVRDLTNIVGGAAQLGGTPYRVLVHCQDAGTAADPTSGRQLEVEFGMRFGL